MVNESKIVNLGRRHNTARAWHLFAQRRFALESLKTVEISEVTSVEAQVCGRAISLCAPSYRGNVMKRRFSQVNGKTAVLVAVPVLNEETAISACLHSLLHQVGEEELCIVVADGGSTDRTCEIVRSFQAKYDNLHLVANPARLQSAAVNLVAGLSYPGEVLVRADAHATYPAGFVHTCVANLQATDAVSVVVPMRTEGKTSFQRAVAAAQNSLMGNGGAAHRRNGAARFVDHGHHAAFRRSFFLELGGYNESFRCNEDAEYDARVGKAGGRVWLCPDAAITYFPRSTAMALARQYRNHGRGRADTLLTHRMTPKLRQVAPVGIAGLFAISLILGWFWRPAGMAAVAIIATYALFGLVEALKARRLSQVSAGLAAAVMHFSWAYGFVTRLVSASLAQAMQNRGAAVSPPAIFRSHQGDATAGN